MRFANKKIYIHLQMFFFFFIPQTLTLCLAFICEPLSVDL